MDGAGPAEHGKGSARGKARVRSPWLAVLSLAGIVVLIGLGVWQLERRSWKLALIDRVEHRVHAAPSALPAPSSWPAVTAASDEYRHVTVTGRFLNDRETLTQAVTEAGGGYWVLTPLQTADGAIVLVNRGFVPPERREQATRRDGLATGTVEVTGLLRMTEPKGGFLRTNDPAHERWYSRDVAAIAAAHGLHDIAPFFIDADASSADAGLYPIGGLTVVRFPNNHLIYALTWFGLAFMLAGQLLVTFGGGLFRRRRNVREGASAARGPRGTGSDAGTIVEPT